MKSKPAIFTARAAGFTIVEVMISMTIVVSVLGMAMSSFVFSLRAMYKDTQRLATNASLRSFMAQVSKETLDASYFYLFPYYTAIDTSVDLTTDVAPMTQIENAADDDYDKWVAHGDCLVLVTKTSKFRTTDIRQIRIYYRVITNQTGRNNEAALRYYETADWGEGTSSTSNGHTSVAAELNSINLNGNPSRSGSKQISPRTKGRTVPSPYTPYSAGDLYPMFSSESPDSTTTNGFVAINVEFINGGTVNNLLSSSSFNYTISPRR
jgi:type II secretory pathway pseudopilin PulG